MRAAKLVALFLCASAIPSVFAADRPTTPARKESPETAGQPPEVDKLTSLPAEVHRITFARDGKRLIVESVASSLPNGVPKWNRPGGIARPVKTTIYHTLWSLSPHRVARVNPPTGPGILLDPDLHSVAVSAWRSQRTGAGPLDIKRVRETEFFDLASGRKIARPKVWKWLKDSPDIEQPLGFSPNGEVAAVKFVKDRAIHLFDVSTGKPISTIAVSYWHQHPDFSRLFSGDGKLFVVPMPNSTVLAVCEVATGRVLRQLDEYRGASVLAVASDGKALALAYPESKEVRTFDVATGEQTGTWKGHTHGVRDLVFSADGKVLFAAGGDKLVLAWDPAARRQIAQFHAHKSAVTVLALSPDGHTLATGGEDKAVHLWDIRGLTTPGQR